MRARLGVALRLFTGYCDFHGIRHPEIAAFIEHLWRFVALPDDPDALEQWERDGPSLVGTGLGDPWPTGVAELVAKLSVPEIRFRRAVQCTTEIVYSSMYAAADAAGSRRYVEELAALAGSVGIRYPDLESFASSRWGDRGGWGAPTSPEQLEIWRGQRLP